MIGEEDEWRRRGKFLTHKEQRCFRNKEEQCRSNRVPLPINQMMQTLAERAVSHLIVVLQAEDERLGWLIRHLGTPRLTSDTGSLPPIEVPLLNGLSNFV